MGVEIVNDDVTPMSAQRDVDAPIAVGASEVLAFSEVMVGGEAPWEVLDEARTMPRREGVGEPERCRVKFSRL
jgi:hypothetical protein